MKKVIMIVILTVLLIVQGCSSIEKEEFIIEGEENLNMEDMNTDDEKMLIELLDCREQKAKEILADLKDWGISGFLNMKPLEVNEGYLLEGETKADSYYLYIDKRFHLYAIKKIGEKEEYIYREIE